jgi:hypothetical protein
VESALNKYLVPPPTDIGASFFYPDCFIELLFNENYPGTNYHYNFFQATYGCSPSVVNRRIHIYAGSKYVRMGFPNQDDSEDIFNLTNEEKAMLNGLLAYRIDSTSLTVVDSTASTYFDSTAVVLYCVYNNLSSTLSKLIYLYLDLKVNNNISKYNNLDLISSGGLLTSCYEAYVINEYFKHISARAPDLMTTT